MVNDQNYQRKWFFVALVLGVVALFIYRLFSLQVLESDYLSRAENNAYYTKLTHPTRGVIYDRKGQILVANQPAYDLFITFSEAREQKLDTMYLASVLGLSMGELSERMAQVKDRSRNRSYTPYTPQLLMGQIDWRLASRIQEEKYKFPGLEVQSRTVRQYEYHHAAHILGYMAEADPRDIKSDSTLMPGDYVGKSGVEKTYDAVLRGVKGAEFLLRDSRGRIRGRRDGGRRDYLPTNGKDIYLSIDAGLQQLGEELMRGKRGAIVAIEPETGEVLAMVSAPSFDPALLGGKDRGAQLSLLSQQEGKVLNNRAIQGTYPPGSTFKPAQAAIFLAEGVFTPQSAMSCYGGYPRLGGRPKCHPHAPSPALVYSLATSCNSYYCWGMHYLLDDRKHYPSIQEAFDAWKNRMVALGYGYKTGVDLPSERRGFIPNSQTYDRAHKKGWNSSSIISISIGQGEILATPLQIANLAAIVANRGKWRVPHVVSRIDGSELDSTLTAVHDTGISAEQWEYVVQGMAMAVTSGTCRGANFAPGQITVCGKTGTAENPHGQDHSVFIGFAPKDKPKIAIGVYVENGGFGATYGVPIGRVMMEYYLKDGELSPASQGIASSMKSRAISYRHDI